MGHVGKEDRLLSVRVSRVSFLHKQASVFNLQLLPSSQISDVNSKAQQAKNAVRLAVFARTDVLNDMGSISPPIHLFEGH